MMYAVFLLLAAVTSVTAVYCQQLPAIEPTALAEDTESGPGYRWDNPPPTWTCEPELYYQIHQNATYITCDCGCGAIDPDCGFSIDNCAVQTWEPTYDDIFCEGRLVTKDLYYCRLESASCTLLPPGLSRAAGISEAWDCIPDVYNELSDPMTSLNDCDCNCGGFDPDCLGAYNDIYCSDYVDETGAFLPRTWAQGPFCLVQPSGAYCQDRVSDNLQADGSLYCPQLPTLAPWQLVQDGAGYGNPPPGWTCDRWAYMDGEVCDCECGSDAIDPDCGYELRSCGDQTWNPDYTSITCNGVPTYTDWAYCRLESARCTALPPGLSRGATAAWSCIPDVYNELSDDLTSLNDCDCNCASADADCFGNYEYIYCLEVTDSEGAPLPNPKSSGITCEVQSIGVACNVPVLFDDYVFPSGIMVFLIALVVLVDIGLGGLMFFLSKHEDKPLIKRTSPLFLYMLLGAGILLSTSSLLLVTPPTAWENVCSLRVWCISMSFLVFITPLIVKVHRFVQEFRGNVKRKRRFPEHLMYKYCFYTVGFQAFINTTFLGFIEPVDIFYAQTTTLNPDVDYTLVEECTSSFPHLGITLIYCFILLGWVLSLAYETRHMPSKFNEVTPMYVASGFMMIYGLLILGLQFMLGNNPTELGVLRVISVLLGVSVVAGSVVGPKVLKLQEDPNWDPPSLDSKGQVIKKTGASGGTAASKLKTHEGRTNSGNTSATSAMSDSDDE